MNPTASLFKYALASMVAACPTGAVVAQGELAHDEAGYRIHYNAIPTLALGEPIARHYGIERSARTGLLSITVLRKGDSDGDEQAVAAGIDAHSRSLIGHRHAIAMRAVGEPDAPSYIGEFPLRGEETLRFELQVRPDGHPRPITVRFQQHLVGP